MGPIVVISAVGVVALAVAAALVYYIAKGSARGRARTTWLAVTFAVWGVVSYGVFSFATVYYVIPPVWIAALAVAAAVLVGLFFLVGRDVGWRPLRIAALAGLLLCAAVLFGAVGIIGIGGDMVRPLYATRARQIAEANGFTALMPAEEELPTESLPVEVLPEPDAGVMLNYDDFVLQERKAPATVTEADLEALVAPGTRPMGADMPPVPGDATVRHLTVQGHPAVAVEYSVAPSGAAPGGKAERIVVLVTAIEGVDVRMSSSSGERESGGEWVPFEGLTPQDLARIAESLRPIE